MKRFILLLGLLLIFPIASAECDINIVLVNQDPYPAMPGDYVKIVFQVSGIAGSDCGKVEFELLDEYPFSLDPGVESKIVMRTGTYVKDYQNFFLIPYKLRVHEDALDGENKITVRYSFRGGDVVFSEDFNITVEDSRTDFEIHVKDYSIKDRKAVFEILNIGENNVEGLTIDVPQQDRVRIFGTNRIIIGNLNANEEDTATFEAELAEGEIILELMYTDQIGKRRKLEKRVEFDPIYFQEQQEDQASVSPTLAFVIGVILPLVFFYVRSKLKKRKEKKLRRKGAIKL